MKITFENMPDSGFQTVNNAGKQSYAENQMTAQNVTKKAEKSTGYAVQIGKQQSTGKADGVYKKDDVKNDKMSLEELSAMASNMDMNVQKMYMAVMSNSMSAEEFGKMVKDGYQVSDMDIETVVTILDQIKVAVARGGGEISGFTDNISKEAMEQILGSRAYAEALESGLSEASAAYMVEQEMEPTAENLYMAKYSAGKQSGQSGQELPDSFETEDEAFQEQIDKVIVQAGYEVNEENRQDAAFLLKHDIPLTKENLQLYEKIKPFEEGRKEIPEEELKARIAMQVYEGKAPEQADLSRDKSIYEEALEVYQTVQELESEKVTWVSEKKEEGEAVSLKDLKNGGEEPVQDKGLLAARRQLEEVRLRMTVEANIKLLRSGIQIDTMPMERLIKELKAAEEILTGQGIPQAEEAVQKLSELQGMPMTALSFAVSREISFTIAELHEKGSSLQADYEKANERYETMQTMPRADMGDSMQKAFRNVDDILADMQKEPSEENRRAVRMLGYNRLELNEENISRALEMDRKVQNLFRDMKPGKVLQMIREGVDVLHTDIEELDAYLTVQKSEFMEESEDFAKFLHKLDRSGEITPEERENYIGIYRLIRQVEKADGKAEGYLLGSEAAPTLEHLLTAVRSGRKGSMDYKIDEDFAGVSAVQRGKNIIEQINVTPVSDAADTAAYGELMEEMKQAGGRAEDFERALDFLKEMDQPVTVSNLIAASSVLQEDTSIYQKLDDYEKAERQEEELENRQSRLEGYIAELQDSITEESALQEGMEKFAKQAEELLREAEERSGVTELNIRDMQHICRGIRFRSALARESRYQIPVRLEAGYAVMNLTVRSGREGSRAEISVQTEEYGRLEAVFAADRDLKIHGTFFAERNEGVSLLQHVSETIRGALEEEDIAVEEIQVLRGNRIKQPPYGRMQETGENEARDRISTRELYQIAKIFLETVRKE